MKNLFNSVLMRRPKSNFFDLSHDVKMSLQMGALVPTCVLEAVPGDKFKISVENMLRFATLLSPLMHRVNVTTHYYFVPNRILWPNWERWITGDYDATHPFLEMSGMGIGEGSLGDYLGYPTGSLGTGTVLSSVLPLAAYYKIFDEYYRDQNLIDPKFVPVEDGDNTTAYYNLLALSPQHRAWMHDYFTSALPFAQKGDSAVLPLGNFSDVDVELDIQPAPNLGMLVKDSNGDDLIAGDTGYRLRTPDSGMDGTFIQTNSAGTVGELAYLDPNGNLKASTSDLEAQAADINTVRRAFRLQEWLERNARGGTRYIENILAHFGVRSSDARLQRPEYIGGAFQTMTISEVLSTAQTVDSEDETVNPVGQMAGHGISYGRGQQFRYRCEEHGWIIGIINVQPVTAYQQGLPKMLQRSDRLDYYWPSFANIGEQPVLNSELYVDTDDDTRADTFGYVPRYAEYKFVNSRVAGEMKTSLDFWHMGRIFDSQPVLNESFIRCIPTDRVFAVNGLLADQVYAHVFNKVGAVRLMPKFGIPTI